LSCIKKLNDKKQGLSGFGKRSLRDRGKKGTRKKRGVYKTKTGKKKGR